MTTNTNDVSDTLRLVEDAEEAVIKKVKSVYTDFLDFITSDNVLQVAVGLIIAKGFTDVVQSLIDDIIIPIFSLLPFIDKTLQEKFVVLSRGPNYSQGYNTIQQAIDDGAVVMAYGDFISKVINFIALGVFLYAIAQLYALVTKKTIIKHTVQCAYCRKFISPKARRCVNCTSWLDGREDKQTSALARG